MVRGQPGQHDPGRVGQDDADRLARPGSRAGAAAPAWRCGSAGCPGRGRGRRTARSGRRARSTPGSATRTPGSGPAPGAARPAPGPGTAPWSEPAGRRSGVRQDAGRHARLLPPAALAGPTKPAGRRVVEALLAGVACSHDNRMPAVLCLMLRPPTRAMGRWMPERPCACAEEVAMAVPSEPQAETLQPLDRCQPGLSPSCRPGTASHPRRVRRPRASQPPRCCAPSGSSRPRRATGRSWPPCGCISTEIRTAVLGEPGDG